MLTMQQISDQIAVLTSQLQSINSQIFLVPVLSKKDIELKIQRKAIKTQLHALQKAYSKA